MDIIKELVRFSVLQRHIVPRQFSKFRREHVEKLRIELFRTLLNILTIP